MLTYSFACPLPNGMHARPASALEEVARPFAAAVLLTNERTGHDANAKSVLGMVGLDIRLDDPCRVTVDGDDEAAAFATITRFLKHAFPESDQALPVNEEHPNDEALPPMLRAADLVVHRGTAVVAGIGIGRAVRIGGLVVPVSIPMRHAGIPDVEVAKLDTALARLDARYETQLERRARGVEATIVRVHRAITRDPEFRVALVAGIRQRDASVAGAVAEAESRFIGMLFATGSALLRERALDVRDVCGELLREVYGDAVAPGAVGLTADAICLAESLTPGQFLSLDRAHLKGLALAHGGTTSHTVILARSFGIPTIVGVVGIEALGGHDEEMVVDAELGVLVSNLTGSARRYYALERARLDQRQERLRRFQSAAGATLDGRRVEVAANVGTAEEAVKAFASGAEGIGLFRTEMLFLDRDEPPSEEEQFDEYRRALDAAGNKPVIIRTLDVGGDKPIPYLRLPPEDNPFLGYRAVRLYPEFA